jgi:hypothetical protein
MKRLWILAAFAGLTLTSVNSQAQAGPNATLGAPTSMDVHRDGRGAITGTNEHFEATVTKIFLKVLSPSDTAARGGAYGSISDMRIAICPAIHVARERSPSDCTSALIFSAISFDS